MNLSVLGAISLFNF